MLWSRRGGGVPSQLSLSLSPPPLLTVQSPLNRYGHWLSRGPKPSFSLQPTTRPREREGGRGSGDYNNYSLSLIIICLFPLSPFGLKDATCDSVLWLDSRCQMVQFFKSRSGRTYSIEGEVTSYYYDSALDDKWFKFSTLERPHIGHWGRIPGTDENSSGLNTNRDWVPLSRVLKLMCIQYFFFLVLLKFNNILMKHDHMQNSSILACTTLFRAHMRSYP